MIVHLNAKYPSSENLSSTRPHILRMNLRFFDAGEKTEQPTAKKRGKARREGQVAKSPEVTTAFMFILLFAALRSFAPGMFRNMISVYQYGFAMAGDTGSVIDARYIAQYVNYMFTQSLTIVMPVFLIAMGIGIVTNLAQVGWHPTTQPLRIKFSKLNPITGMKRLFRLTALVELFKSLVKFGIIAYVIYTAIRDEIATIPLLAEMEIMESLSYIGNLSVDLGIRVGTMFIFIAAVDYKYTKYRHTKSLKMTKQEVREEYKQAEGNPQVKSKIRSKMREVSMRRMMQSVPEADVIITNPTHYAVALQYDRQGGGAPVVVAKGADYLAKRIKDVARENKVQIVENKQLARAIYASVDIGREIPPELYQAVAEILAFVYKLRNSA